MILIVFKCRNSSLDYYDTVKKFIEKMMEQSIMTTVIDECKKKQFDYTEYWSVERKKEFVNAPHWPIEKWISVLAKGGPKKRFQYCLNPSYLHQFLYSSSNSRTFRKYHLSCSARQCTVTRRFYRVRRRIEVNSEPWFDFRRSQSQKGQTSCYCAPLRIRWIINDRQGKALRLVTSMNRAIQKHLEMLLKNTVCWCNLKLAQQ